MILNIDVFDIIELFIFFVVIYYNIYFIHIFLMVLINSLWCCWW